MRSRNDLTLMTEQQDEDIQDVPRTPPMTITAPEVLMGMLLRNHAEGAIFAPDSRNPQRRNEVINGYVNARLQIFTRLTMEEQRELLGCPLTEIMERLEPVQDNIQIEPKRVVLGDERSEEADYHQQLRRSREALYRVSRVPFFASDSQQNGNVPPVLDGSSHQAQGSDDHHSEISDSDLDSDGTIFRMDC